MTKCANCGTKTLETYTRTGLRLFVCPHVKIRTVKKLNGITKYAEIHCSINVKGLLASFERLVYAQKAHLTLEMLREATKQTINEAKLLEGANLALMLGLPAKQLAQLFKSAMSLGLATGITTEKSIEALCIGVGRRSRLILDNIGITFKAKDAYNAYPKLDKNEAWQKYAIKLITKKARSLN